MKTMKKRGILTGILILMMIMMTLAGCGTSGDATDNGDNGDNGDAVTALESTFPMTVTDSDGNEITFDEAPQRIISVAPSLTETLFAIGAGDMVVGRTDYCNYPEEALAVESIGTFRNPNTELILDMEPDLIFATGAAPEEAQALFDTAGIKVIVINPTTVDEIEESILLMGQVLDVNEGAAQVNAEIETARTSVKEALGEVEAKLVYVEISASHYTAGSETYMSAIIEDELGAINLGSEAGSGWVQLSEEFIVEKDPQVIIRSVSMGGDTVEEIAESLKSTTAYVNGDVVDVSSDSYQNDIMTRAGARVGETIQFFAKSIYPELFE